MQLHTSTDVKTFLLHVERIYKFASSSLPGEQPERPRPKVGEKAGCMQGEWTEAYCALDRAVAGILIARTIEVSPLRITRRTRVSLLIPPVLGLKLLLTGCENWECFKSILSTHPHVLLPKLQNGFQRVTFKGKLILDQDSTIFAIRRKIHRNS